jgi:hypothetical protein
MIFTIIKYFENYKFWNIKDEVTVHEVTVHEVCDLLERGFYNNCKEWVIDIKNLKE